MGQWVTVITFTYPHEAHIVKSFLESEGITVFLKDELTVQIHNFYSNSVGGVKLQVPESEAEQTLQILLEAGYIQTDNNKASKKLYSFPKTDPLACPYCHSENICIKDRPRNLSLFTSLFLWLPLPIFKQNYFCFDCEKEWKFYK